MNFIKAKQFQLITLLLIGIIALCSTIYYNLNKVGTAQGTDPKVTIHIKKGMTFQAITEELAKEQVIDAPMTFYWWGRLVGFSSQVPEGIYYLPKHLTVLAAMEQLKDAQYLRITIPEGYTVEDIAQLLAGKTKFTPEEFLAAAKNYAPYDYMKPALADKNVKYGVEGFLFPDTYEISQNASPEEILHLMTENFNRKLTPQIRQLAQEHQLSIYQLVNMAALVEKEAKYKEDQPIIAQVFYKRLAINMPLQSDATIQYAMPGHKEEFSIADTKYDSPYNTYLHYGLPPGPIANPGIGAIEAVLHPAQTDYLYFVADDQGRNHYSHSYEEHEKTIGEIYK